MSAEYRRKIVNWLTSMLVLHLIILVSALFDWVNQTRFLIADNPDDLWVQFASFLYVAPGYAVLFAILWIWHVGDFIQKGSPKTMWLRAIDRHQILLIALLLFGASILLLQTSWLNDVGCSEPQLEADLGFWDGCGASTPWWKELIGFALLVVLVLIGVAKLALALASRATALRK